jgi:hypothetical protein
MDPLSALAIASSTAQFLGQTIKVIQGLYGYCQTAYEAPRRSRELQAEVIQVSNVLMDLQSALKSIPEDAQFPKTIKLLSESSTEFTQVMNEMASRIEVQQRNLGKRLKWPFNEKQNNKYLSKVEAFKQTATLSLSIVQLYVPLLLHSVCRHTTQGMSTQIGQIHQMQLGISF